MWCFLSVREWDLCISNEWGVSGGNIFLWEQKALGVSLFIARLGQYLHVLSFTSGLKFQANVWVQVKSDMSSLMGTISCPGWGIETRWSNRSFPSLTAMNLVCDALSSTMLRPLISPKTIAIASKRLAQAVESWQTSLVIDTFHLIGSGSRIQIAACLMQERRGCFTAQLLPCVERMSPA